MTANEQRQDNDKIAEIKLDHEWRKKKHAGERDDNRIDEVDILLKEIKELREENSELNKKVSLFEKASSLTPKGWIYFMFMEEENKRLKEESVKLLAVVQAARGLKNQCYPKIKTFNAETKIDLKYLFKSVDALDALDDKDDLK